MVDAGNMEGALALASRYNLAVGWEGGGGGEGGEGGGGGAAQTHESRCG